MPTASTVTGRAAIRADGALSTDLSRQGDPIVPIVLLMHVLTTAEAIWREERGFRPTLFAYVVRLGNRLGKRHNTVFVIYTRIS
jgi:hypothetical protein